MPQGRRSARDESACNGHFIPPEDWHEPTGKAGREVRIIEQPPGDGFRHVVTPAEIRQRLKQLPAHFINALETIQLSRITRKKQRFPCYGMQWGTSIYLYPLDESLVEFFARPPQTQERIEAEMYGGRWVQRSATHWELIWTMAAVKDFYLNNILIHELGHLLDGRNTAYADRERFANWFAIRYGHKSKHRHSGREMRTARKPIRRHHAKR